MKDFLNKLATAQTAANTAGNPAETTNAIAIGGAGFDIAVNPEMMGVLFTITSAAVAGAAETYIFRAIASSGHPLTADVVVLGEVRFSTAEALALLTAGKSVFVPIAPGRIADSSTHIGGSVDAVGALASVTYDADFVPVSSVPGWKAYDGAVTEI